MDRDVAAGSAPALRRLDATARGRVQGVGFRMHVAEAADHAGVVGWVANDGRDHVRCVAEGSEAALTELLEAIRNGPPGARVDGVDESWSVATGAFSTFSIRAGSHSGD
jgi:acylphosphatase